MANFALVDSTTNKVINTIVGDPEKVNSMSLGDSIQVIEYKRDGTLRNEAAVGSYYLPSEDLFTNEKEGESWTFNSSTNQYDPPNAEPTLTAEQVSNHFRYAWNEDNYKSRESGWILTKKNNVVN